MRNLLMHRGNKEQLILTGISENLILLNRTLSNGNVANLKNLYINYFQLLYILVNVFFTFCEFRVMISC